MKILDNTKSLSTLVADTSNGLGQIQPLTCTVTEELNGIYELDFTVNVNDRHYADLKNSGLVKVTVGDGSEQIFRIYKIDEPINMISSVHCQHITYDLSKVVVKPFTATGAVNIKNQLVSNMLGSYPFSTWTDITNTTSTFTNDIPRYFRECLGGYEGSVLDVLRPEYEWDNLTVKLHARRGADNGVRISYGKNLIDYSQEQNNENVYDGVYGYAVVDEVTYKADSYYNKTGATYPRILNVDFSSDYESGQIPTPSELLQKATTYAQNNSIEVPSINIKIDFIPLWQTEEYKNILPLERVSLGDTVHVYFDKLNVEASSRVIKTQWNVLTNKYDSIELGDAKANLNTIITDSISTAVDEAVSDLDIDVGWLDTKAENMFKLIANGVGLHITKDSAGRIILHNDEDISQSQYQYMITAQGFMMSDDYGQEGSWRSGWTTSGDAYMNSLSTIVLDALEIHGSTITGSIINFGDLTDKYITAKPFTNGITFDGTGTIRMQPQEYFYVNNLASDGTHMYNQIVMNKQGATYNSNLVELINYDDTQNYLTANFIEMDAHMNEGGVVYNRTIFNNYSTNTGTQYNGNYFGLFAGSTYNTSRFNNYKLNQVPGNSPLVANTLLLNTNSTDNRTRAQLVNKNFQSDQDANYLTLNSTASQNTTWLYNRHTDTDQTANGIYMYSLKTSSKNYMEIFNRGFEYGGNANEIKLSSDTSGNTFELNNRDGSNIITNELKMSSDKTTLLWSGNDLKLWSQGAVRIVANTSIGGTTGGSQDILLHGKTIKLIKNGDGEFSLYSGASETNSSRWNLVIPNLSVGQTGNLQVTRVR